MGRVPGQKVASLSIRIPGVSIDAFNRGMDDEEVPGPDSFQKQGYNDGRRNVPPPEATRLGESELDIINTFRDYLHAFRERGKDFLYQIIEAIDRKQAECKEPPFDKRLAEIKAKAGNVKFERTIELEEAIEGEETWRREFRHFERTNGINRQPIYPSSRFLSIVILFLVIIAEGFANSIIFAKGNDLGLLGGALEALLFSATNVVISFGAGYVILRNLNSRAIFIKTLAMAGTGAAIVMIMAINFGVAHYRDYLVETAKVQEQKAALAKTKAHEEAEAIRLRMSGAESGAVTVPENKSGRAAVKRQQFPTGEHPDRVTPVPSAAQEGQTLSTEGETLRRIILNPFSFQSYSAIILLLLGLCIAAFSVYEGYHFDDPVPGYGAVHRRYIKRKDSLQHTRERIIKKIANILNEDFKNIEAQVADFNDMVSELKTYHAAFENFKTYIEDHSPSYEERCREGLMVYRSANEYVRNEPPPETFSQFPKLGDGPSLPNLHARPHDLEVLIERAEHLSERARQARIELLRELEHQTEITNSYFHEIEQRVIERLRAQAERDQREPQGWNNNTSI